MSPFVGGAFGSGLRPQFEVVLAVLAARALRRSVRVVLTRPQMYALGYRPAMIQRIELGANTGGTLDAITHDAITVTSQYEDYFRQETGWSGLLYKCANARYAHKLARLDLPTSCDMRAPSAATGVYALECAMDELAVALKLDPLELRLRCYSDRDQNNDRPFSSKALRECYRQGAEAFGWDKRNPEPRSMRDGGDLVGWGMATGIWEASQTPITVRIVAERQRPCGGRVRNLRHRHRHLHHHGAGRGRHARAAAREHQHQARRLESAAIAGRRRIMDCGLGVEWDRDDSRRNPRRAVASGQADAKFATREHGVRRSHARGRQAGEQGRRVAFGVDRRCHAARRRGPHRAGENHQPQQ